MWGGGEGEAVRRSLWLRPRNVRQCASAGIGERMLLAILTNGFPRFNLIPARSLLMHGARALALFVCHVFDSLVFDCIP
jgi:hypothetical protein